MDSSPGIRKYPTRRSGIQACWINETKFWKSDDKQSAKITRSGWVQDVENGLSEFPHVVLNQARVHDFYLDVMRKSACKLEP